MIYDVFIDPDVVLYFKYSSRSVLKKNTKKLLTCMHSIYVHNYRYDI